MMEIFREVIRQFELKVSALNKERHAGPFRRLEVTVLGQQGLLIREELQKKLHLLATTDFDAKLNGEPPLEDIFKGLLIKAGLLWDKDSEYIWLPDETAYEVIYKSEIIEINSPLPTYLIVSKAVKAPEKNRALVAQAIVEFGDELIMLLEKYNVTISDFLGEL